MIPSHDHLARAAEQAIRETFGVRKDAVTGRATEFRCMLASAAICTLLIEDGHDSMFVAGSLDVDRRGERPLTLAMHAVSQIGDELLDVSISQAHRSRFGSTLNVPFLAYPMRTGVEDGLSVVTQLDRLTIVFRPSASITQAVMSVPDTQPARVAEIVDRMRTVLVRNGAYKRTN